MRDVLGIGKKQWGENKMTYQTYEEILDEAISEAERFIKRAKMAKAHVKIARDNVGKYWSDREPHHAGMYCAATKRASMDLSRVLVDIRGNRKRQ